MVMATHAHAELLLPLQLHDAMRCRTGGDPLGRSSEDLQTLLFSQCGAEYYWLPWKFIRLAPHNLVSSGRK
jgi:hypothetical protein